MGFFAWLSGLNELFQLIIGIAAISSVASVVGTVVRGLTGNEGRKAMRELTVRADALEQMCDGLRAEVQALRGEAARVSELEERLDFAERLLARRSAPHGELTP